MNKDIRAIRTVSVVRECTLLSLLALAAMTCALCFALSSKATAADDPRWVEIPEMQWLSTTEAIPTYEYATAHSALLDDWSAQSRSSMERVSAYLKAESYRASAACKAQLDAAARTLSRLAVRMAGAAKPNLRELDQAFAAAERAIATHYLELAQRSRASVPALTGRYLAAAARSVESAAYRAGYELGEAELTGLRDARAAADKLAAGEDWAGAKGADAFTHVHAVLDSLVARATH